MNVTELASQLTSVLREMARRHRQWASLAERHRIDLVGRRMDAVLEGAMALDAALENMGPFDDRRIELSCALGVALGIPCDDRVPSIAELRDALGAEASKILVEAAKELKAAVAAATQIAERNRGLAEAGRRSTEATVKALTKIVVRSRSTQAAYDRAGSRSTGVAVPVNRQDWKG